MRRRTVSGCPGKDLAMTWSRAVALVVGIAITAILGQLAGLNWYFSFVLGLAGYFVTRYVIWAIAERRRFKSEFDQLVKDYHKK
jgi:membrane protein implicated in regulation of membrane protease activity